MFEETEVLIVETETATSKLRSLLGECDQFLREQDRKDQEKLRPRPLDSQPTLRMELSGHREGVVSRYEVHSVSRHELDLTVRCRAWKGLTEPDLYKSVGKVATVKFYKNDESEGVFYGCLLRSAEWVDALDGEPGTSEIDWVITLPKEVLKPGTNLILAKNSRDARIASLELGLKHWVYVNHEEQIRGRTDCTVFLVEEWYLHPRSTYFKAECAAIPGVEWRNHDFQIKPEEDS